MRDFTLAKYEQLLSVIRDLDIPVYGVLDWVRHCPQSGLMMRHDVDRCPGNAMAMAEVERNYGVKSTYYFRWRNGGFDTDVIERVRQAGHEIGYHYEDLCEASGDVTRAGQLFEQHLAQLRRITQVRTVAMHGRPMSRWNNKQLWQESDFGSLGIEADAFCTVDYSNTYYFTDTGRSWSSESVNIRDKVEGALSSDVSETDDLIEFIGRNPDRKMAVVMHPERWAVGLFDYTISLLRDMTINSVKRILVLLGRV